VQYQKVESIGIIANRSISSFVSIIASLAAGIPYVPIHYKYPLKRQISILERAECSVLFLDETNASVMEKLLPKITKSVSILWIGSENIDKNFEIPQWHRLVSVNATAGREPEISDTRAACLLFTSGSTGEPKGIRIKHSNIISYVKSIQKIYKPNETDRFSQIFDQTFDLSLHDMFVAWSTGASLFCIPDKERHAPGRFIKSHSLTFWFSTPSTIALMQGAKLLKANSFSTLRLSLFCGEPLSSELAENWMAAAPNSRLHNLYGPTEATIAITQTKITKKLLNNVDTTVPIGFPLSGQVAGLCNSRGEFIMVQHGTQGELVVAGSQVTEGYWRDKQSTKSKFISGPSGEEANNIKWYKTGDRVVFDSEYGFLFLGRLDDQVKIMGHRVEISEIETVLRKVTKIPTVAVIVTPQKILRSPAIVAFVGKSQFSPAELKNLCRQFLPWYMIPQRVIEINEWPLNSSSKTDKKALYKFVEESIG
jgi:amino acid adenylation domain-containing protein